MKYFVVVAFAVVFLAACPSKRQEAPEAAPEAAPEFTIESDTAEIEAAPEAQAVEVEVESEFMEY